MNKPALGFAVTGSFCNHQNALAVLRTLTEKWDVVPILSFASASLDTRFGTARELAAALTEITGRTPVATLGEAERFGPAQPLDAMLVCPCTGTTAARLAHGISDTPVTLAAKAHLRTDRPLLLALASNDAMSANLGSLAALVNRRHIWLVPMKQDDPRGKPHSLVADFTKVGEALDAMTEGRQLYPLFL